jgi:hypothetical protein
VVSFAYPLRFFRVVAPLPPLVGWTFLVLVLIGTLVIVHDPTRAASALIPVLLLQLFAASSGFEVPARRGHYDLLLTSGSGRASMALVHWGTSVAPGIIAWLALVVIEQLASGGNVSRLLASGTLAALCLVSTLPWAITVRLPRFSGGIGWLLALAISVSVWPSARVSIGQSSPDIASLLFSTWGFLVNPAGLVGHELRLTDLTAIAPALVFACASMVAACRWVSRAGVPLEAAQ